MKHLLLAILTAFCVSSYALDPCADAIRFTDDFSATLEPGTYYFVSTTSYLPLSIEIYPQEQSENEPQAELDLTCTPGHYEDEDVQQIVDLITGAGFSLPARPYLKPITVDEVEGYSLSFTGDVFPQLYTRFGIVYPVEVHVKLKLEQTSLVHAYSESRHAQCLDYATSIDLGDSIFIADGDESAVVEWHASQLSRDEYAIVWNGEPATFVLGANCDVKLDDMYSMQLPFNPHDTMYIIPEYSKIFLQQFKTPFMYARHYGGAGWLKFVPCHVPRFLQNIVIGGVNAVIDNEKMTITAILPYGTDRAEALQNAVCSPALSPMTQTGPEIINDGNTLRFGPLEYDLQGVVVAENTMSHDATLAEITIDGVPIEDFSPSITNYQVVVTTSEPYVSAQCNDSKAAYEVDIVGEQPATITITVTAEAGNTLEYTLSVTYDLPPLSSDATLSAIIIGGENLQGFSSDVFEYEYDVIGSELPTVDAVANDENASLTIVEPVAENAYTAQITVTAQNGAELTYTVKLNYNNTAIVDAEADASHDFTHARVYSATGKLVAKDYSAAQLPAGIYLLRTATASKKIIVYK